MPKEIAFKYLRFYEDKATLMHHFFFPLNLKELKDFRVRGIKNNNLLVDDDFQARDERRLEFFIQRKFNELKTLLDKKPAIYLHSGLNIPLIGLVEVGIIDRGTNVIEIRPVTGCNLKCPFCSVSPEKRERNFIIEPEFLVEKLKALIQIKTKNTKIFINSQGEPLLYAPLAYLIKGMKIQDKIDSISIVTNGTLLTENKLEELKRAGLDTLYVSLHTLDKKKAKKLSGSIDINPERILSNILYAKEQGIKVVLTPVVIFGENEKDIEKLARFCAEKGLKIAPQNYLRYKFGEKNYQQRDFDYFYNWLNNLKQDIGEKAFQLPLSIEEDNAPPNPFIKGKVEKIPIVLPGFFKHEGIGSLYGRLVSIINGEGKKTAKARIIRTKHNIIAAKCLN
jgi:hypothetical protein